MSQRWLVTVVLSVGGLSTDALGQPPKTGGTPATPENIEAAYKLSLAAAAEYEIRIGKDKSEKPLELIREPKLKWSNPAMSDVQGNVFLWTRDARPLVVGSFTKWFSPRSVMQHEFHSLAEEPLSAKFHGEPVWATGEAGLTFAAVPAPRPRPPKRRSDSCNSRSSRRSFPRPRNTETRPSDTELRLLPQPIHSYAAPNQGVSSGGLFAFVRGTDPEVFLLIEARGTDAAPLAIRGCPHDEHGGAATPARRQAGLEGGPPSLGRRLRPPRTPLHRLPAQRDPRVPERSHRQALALIEDIWLADSDS